jgi:MarR family transcriptional regulator for hemolysin
LKVREWQLDPEVGSIVHDVARLMRVSFERRIRDLGLTRTQWWVISSLLRMDGATQTELATYLQMERSPVAKVLEILERDGWLERRPDPTDRRVKRVYSTNRIKPHLPVLGAAALEVFQLATADLDEGARAHLLSDLGLMRRNLAGLLDDPYDKEAPPADAAAAGAGGAP